MARRLKVYRAPMGFADTVVAAPNQAAALAAWGARQNLFAEGLAAVTDDPAAVEAAQADPGEVLQRPAGSTGPFRPGPASAPALPVTRPKARPRQGGAKVGSAASPKPDPAPDRSALTAAEAALRDLDAEAAERCAGLARRREALEREARDLDREIAGRRRAASQALDKAQAAYRRASGEADPR
jgi:colicin import membrane protein